MKWNVQVLPIVALSTEAACRRALARVYGNAQVAGELVSFEIGDVTDQNDPSIAASNFELETLCVFEADTAEGARAQAKSVTERRGLQTGEIADFEVSADTTAIEEDDVESMDEVPAS